MTNEELAKGPDHSDGPDTTQPWTITHAKTAGVSPGFTIKDSRGDTYFLKFDPVGYPQLATSSEVVSTKFFYAFGYNVPENYCVFVSESQFKIGKDVKLLSGKPFTEKFLKQILKNVPHTNGKIEVVASKKLENGIGPFQYYSTRKDDPNDVIPHENRRELRALKVFASWVNHYDIRSVNSLDIFVKNGEGGYVKHYLLDFGSTFGSAGWGIAMRREGHEYALEWTPILKSAVTFGIWDRPWRSYKYPDYPAVGRFESQHFVPADWKPGFPNPAFNRMQNDDAFWATQIIMKFNDQAVATLVKTGQYSDPNAAAYLTNALIERRNKIVHYYLSLLNPLSNFSVDGSKLQFKNLGETASIGSVDHYEYQWFSYDNDKQVAEPLTSPLSSTTPSLQIPEESSAYLVVRIKTYSQDMPNWKKDVNVYLRNSEIKSVVGIERQN